MELVMIEDIECIREMYSCELSRKILNVPMRVGYIPIVTCQYALIDWPTNKRFGPIVWMKLFLQ